MKNLRALCLSVPLAGMILAAGACSEERIRFESGTNFGDAGTADAPVCGLQCSLDGRSVINTCSGEAVQTCTDDQACGEARCQAPCAAAAADRRSDGCEYFFQPPQFARVMKQSCFAVFVTNTSNKPVDLSLDLEAQPLDISKSLFRTEPGSAALIPFSGSLAAGESTILFVSDGDPNAPPTAEDRVMPCPKDVVPASRVDTLPNGTGFGSAFHLESTLPVAVTSIYPFGGAPSWGPSATLLLPVSTWTTDHILINGWEGNKPGVQIVASEDETEITILPKRDIQRSITVPGAPAGAPATYRLAKGQVLQLTQSQELSGSFLSSTKPTTVFGGNACANIPATGGYCDILGQQIPGFDNWGSEYVGVGYRPRLGNEHELIAYRIVAARDGTALDYDPLPPAGAPLTMSAGEVATFTQGTGDAFVVRTQDADHAIYVAAYMSGSQQSLDAMSGRKAIQFGGRGDPEFVNVVPTGQYLNSYSFFADPTYGDTSLVIVRARSGGGFKDVWLECAGGNLTGFHPIGTRGEYEFVRVDLARESRPGDTFGSNVCRTGLHRMRSEGPFTATLWGWDLYASYAYPSGMAQRKLVTTPLLPIQ